MEEAEGRLHNGGWEDKWLDEVDEIFLKHFASVSKTFHPLYPAIYRCLEYIYIYRYNAGPIYVFGFSEIRKGEHELSLKFVVCP